MLKYMIVFLEFFKAGLFAVGGGLATLPFLKAMVGKYPWFTAAELTNMIAISESTPGPMGVNMATFAGFKAGGVLGAIIATAGLVCPSILIIIGVSKILEKFKNSKLVKNAFYALRPASAGLIIGAMFDVFLMSLFHIEYIKVNFLKTLNIPAIVIFVVGFLCIKKFDKVHPIVFILAGAIFGVVFQL
ncbi:MAG: chromate transporter [Anaerostipes sp.]|uniref:chromate transporter n=1 Tax=Anaerostipes sp. 992a TaxID=1261637 RepID=UPI000951DE6F|nr:chromate transporter [Anaerostipes sp. 992a]MCI5951032.1 chromate transporter [Anaerostipes sp.]MDD5968542.1 chromate transporter [Anaerostipes sp.]OLR62887.1 chromate transporter [Anaerostipes sp. 992a]